MEKMEQLEQRITALENRNDKMFERCIMTMVSITKTMVQIQNRLTKVEETTLAIQKSLCA